MNNYEQLLKNNMARFSLMLLVFFVLLIAITGCANFFNGEYYLETGQYESGIQVFAQKIIENPDVAAYHYYLGRFELARKQYKKAETYLEQAVFLSSEKDVYHFWLGVSRGGMKKLQLEIQSYRTAIDLNARNWNAHTYLGHSLVRAKKYRAALESYDTALSLHPENASALYSRALILRKLNQTAQATAAFKRYLTAYGDGSKSIAAARFLNQMGDFDYRIHLFGRRRHVLGKIDFDPLTLELKREALPFLGRVGGILKKESNLVLYILSYHNGNKQLAEKKANAIKAYLLNQYPAIDSRQIKFSWFGIPERIHAGNQIHTLDVSINLFASLTASTN